jgi:hypothetical protein
LNNQGADGVHGVHPQLGSIVQCSDKRVQQPATNTKTWVLSLKSRS